MPTEIETQSYHETIAKRGFRFTKQRLEVYQALLEKRDHPTATEVYARVKERIPSISLATVYNCLETLAECGLAKHVNIDRAPSRYCPNLEEHGHFYCEQCGAVIDVPFKNRKNLEETWAIPANSIVTHHEVAFRGLCPECAILKGTEGTKETEGTQGSETVQGTDTSHATLKGTGSSEEALVADTIKALVAENQPTTETGEQASTQEPEILPS